MTKPYVTKSQWLSRLQEQGPNAVEKANVQIEKYERGAREMGARAKEYSGEARVFAQSASDQWQATADALRAAVNEYMED